MPNDDFKWLVSDEKVANVNNKGILKITDIGRFNIKIDDKNNHV